MLRNRSRFTAKAVKMTSTLVLPRKITHILIFAIVALPNVCSSQTGGNHPPVPSASPATNGAVAQEKRLPPPKSFDVSALDNSVDPCEDFYQYACGSWRKSNPIPAGWSHWSRFNELAEYNRGLLRNILEKAAVNDTGRDAITQRIGDFYASCMDEPTLNAKGYAPLKPLLDRIAAISGKDQLIETIAYLNSSGPGKGDALFLFSVSPDLHHAGVGMANIFQGGIGLPEPDYYLNPSTRSQETRIHYQQHLVKLFRLLGGDDSAAQKEAQSAMKIEMQLAQVMFDRGKMRDPRNRDHKMSVAELAALAPNVQFQRYFRFFDAPAFKEVNVINPGFMQQVNGMLDSVPLEDWKAYLKSHTVQAAAPYLSDIFVQENFDFVGHYLNGQSQLAPHWSRCVQLTDRLLGDSLGQLYVRQTLDEESKQRVQKIVDAVERTLAADIQALSWMTAQTKEQAQLKLKAITNRVGYPDRWRDYNSVKIVRGDLLANVEQANAFNRRHMLGQIGQDLDKKEWGMTPPTVNAYYNPEENDINFPAGILQPPFFDRSQDDAVNFGAIGVVIAHTLAYGFDDQGSRFDEQGNLRNWWTDADRQEFRRRTACVADQYSSFPTETGVNLNGHLTLGANVADNQGLRIAMLAFRNAQNADSAVGQKKEEFTPEQRFFLSFAQIWCENRTPDYARRVTQTDQHSPGRYRVIGPLQNNPDFARAFGCKAGQKMINQNACRVW